MIEYQKEVCDVLVIGSGGAGLRSAIALKDAGVDVLVVGKCKKSDAHTILATGGINASLATMDEKDSWQLHAADTIRDGGHINDTNAVLTLCKNAPQAVQELARWGCKFHREANGKITQRFFGAATFRRACFVGDKTGKAILETLVKQVEKRKIRFKSEVYVISLLGEKKEVHAALALDIRNGTLVVIQAKKIILATGGHSRMFARSSSRFWENTGDGIALAYNQGATFMDMEMFQFHPTGMLWPSVAEGVLVTEAVRGEGGILTNALGERFMTRYDPKRMELSARDIVARAIYTEVQQGRGTTRGGVWLDISHKPKDYIKKRLPKMYEQFKHYAHIDISKEKMEVAPTAHYSMGGVYTDFSTGETTIKNLYAIGEVTAGTHGANRLGGNSLAEIIVFGKLVGEHVARLVKKQKEFVPLNLLQLAEVTSNLVATANNPTGIDPIIIKKRIQKMMWECCGVVRTRDKMIHALQELKTIQKQFLKVTGSLKMNESLITALDVQNMIPTCMMILYSALERKESRGAHYRSDYPHESAAFKNNILCIPTSNGIVTKTKKIEPVPKAVTQLINHPPAQSHLLE